MLHPLFRVDVSLTCKSVGFSSEFSGTIFNDIIKAGKMFGPLGLLLGEEFCGIEYLRVL